MKKELVYFFIFARGDILLRFRDDFEKKGEAMEEFWDTFDKIDF